MWTQLFWPHNVAASAMNRMADSSWRAFGARGSRTSRKIDNTGCIEAQTRRPLSESTFIPLATAPLHKCDSPAGRWGRAPEGALETRRCRPVRPPAPPFGSAGLAQHARRAGAQNGSTFVIVVTTAPILPGNWTTDLFELCVGRSRQRPDE